VFFLATSLLVPGLALGQELAGLVGTVTDPAGAAVAYAAVKLVTRTGSTLEGPHFSNVDLGVAKNFPWWGEKYRLQFRADAFNAFNHANFGLPDTSISGNTFGVITTQVGQELARAMQFSLRFEF
jgi:hypothetical protein